MLLTKHSSNNLSSTETPIERHKRIRVRRAETRRTRSSIPKRRKGSVKRNSLQRKRHDACAEHLHTQTRLVWDCHDCLQNGQGWWCQGDLAYMGIDGHRLSVPLVVEWYGHGKHTSNTWEKAVSSMFLGVFWRNPGNPMTCLGTGIGPRNGQSHESCRKNCDRCGDRKKRVLSSVLDAKHLGSLTVQNMKATGTPKKESCSRLFSARIRSGVAKKLLPRN